MLFRLVRRTGLHSDSEISRLARWHGLGTFADAVQHVRSLPYGRISDRSDYRRPARHQDSSSASGNRISSAGRRAIAQQRD